MKVEELEDLKYTLDERGTYEGYWELDEDKFSDFEFLRRLELLHNAYDYLDQYVQSQFKEKNIDLDF